jgi:hypothetical protein
VIYFLQSDRDGLVKIGRTKDLTSRLKSLGVATVAALRLIRSLDAPDWVETWLHQHFYARHSRGEWFHYHPEMLTVVPPDVFDPSNSEALTLRISRAQLRQLDDWRRGQPDLPSRTEAIRRLMTLTLGAPKAPARKRPARLDVHVQAARMGT